MSDDLIGRGVVEVVGNTDDVTAKIAKVGDDVEKMARRAVKSGKDASDGLNQIGDGAEKSTAKLDVSARRVENSMKRQTAALIAGKKSGADYTLTLARLNGVNTSGLDAVAKQLKSAERNASLAADANKKLAESQRFLSSLKFDTDKIGKSAADLAAVKAAQLGVSEAAGPMIAKMRAAEQGATGMGAAFSKASGYIKLAVAGMASFSVAKLVKDSTMLAARFETMGVVMNVAGNNAGYTRAEMAKLELQMQKTGISMIGSREVLTSLATANIDLASATRLARAAQDLAVVGNINSTEALNRMVGGIKSGQVEVLKTLGLNVSFEASYKKMAESLGITSDALTEQQKTMARTNVVLEESSRYSGIYEESMTSAGKAIGSMSRLWEDFKVKAGDAFLPTLAAAVFDLTDALKLANEQLAKAGDDGTINSIGSTLAGAFKTVTQTVIVLGANVAYVFSAIGKEIEGIIKQAGALATFDFDGAAKIRDALRADAAASRAAIDAFSDRIMGVGVKPVAATVKPTVSEADRIAAGEASRKLAEQEAARAAWAKITEENLSKQAVHAKAIAAIESAGLAAGKTRVEIEQQIAAYKAKNAGAAASRASASQNEITRLKSLVEVERQREAALHSLGAAQTNLNEGEKLAIQYSEKIKIATNEKTRAQLEANKALASEYGARKRANDEMDKWRKTQESTIDSLEKQSLALRDQIETYGMGKSAIEAMTVARLEEQLAMAEGSGVSEATIDGLRRELEARKELMSATAGLEVLDANKKAAEEAAKEWQRTNEQIGQSLTDALMRGFEDGKSFGQNFRDTLMNMFRTLVLRPIIEPIMNQVAGGVQSFLGIGGQQQAGGGFGFGGGGAFGAGAVSNIGGWLSTSGVAPDMGANMVMNADKIAGAAGSILGYGKAIYDFTEGNYGSSIGTAIGTYILPGVGTMIGSLAGGLVDSIFGGGPPKTRHGQRTQIDWSGDAFDISKRDDRVDAGAADAVLALTQASVTAANEIFKRVGVDAAIESFSALMESSLQGDRQGVLSGGTLRIGDQTSSIGVLDSPSSQFGFGGWSDKDMFSRLATDIQLSILEAFQQAGVMSSLLEGVNIRGLGEEAAAQLAATVQAVVQEVSAFQTAVESLPFANLRDLGFDAAQGLIAAAGGLENLDAGMTSYFQNFYSEAEQLEWATQQMGTAFAGLGMNMPDVTQGADAAKAAYRGLVESLDLTSVWGQQAYAALMTLSGGFAELVVGMDELNSSVQTVETGIDSLAVAAGQFKSAAMAAQRAMQMMTTGGSLADRLGGMLGLAPVFGPMREQELWDTIGSASYEQQIEMAGELTDIVLDRISKEQQANQERIASLKQEMTTLSRMRDLGASLQNYVRSLESSNLAPYSLQEKVGIAEDELASLVSAARGGDENAMRQVQGALQNALSLWREYGASGAEYQVAYHRLTGMVGNLASGATSEAARQIAQLEAQAASLEGISGYSAESLAQLQQLYDITTAATEAAQAQYANDLANANTELAQLESMGLDTARLHEIADLLKDMPALIGAQLAGASAAREQQYYQDKLNQLQATGSTAGGIDWMGASTSDLAAYFESVGTTPGQHYNEYGKDEGLSYGGATRDQRYYAAKLAQLQAANSMDGGIDWMGATTSDLAAYFRSLGITPEEHYQRYGKSEGLSYAVGTSYVPQDMTANIHRGEIIIDPRSSDILRRYGIGVQGKTASDGEVVAELRAINTRLERIEAQDRRLSSDQIAAINSNADHVTKGVGESVERRNRDDVNERNSKRRGLAYDRR